VKPGCATRFHRLAPKRLVSVASKLSDSRAFGGSPAEALAEVEKAT